MELNRIQRMNYFCFKWCKIKIVVLCTECERFETRASAGHFWLRSLEQNKSFQAFDI